MNERLAPAVLESRAPATGEILGHVRVATPDEVRVAVARARRAQVRWASVEVTERCQRLLTFSERLVRARDELADGLALECGKPRQEALLTEVAPLLALMKHYGSRAPRLLAARSISLALFKHRRSEVRYEPRGVIGIISPWNFPLLIPFADAFTALFAGNAAVIKPSEHAPLIAQTVKRLWDESGLDPDLLQIVAGRGETGQALIQAGVQKIVFTGGVETGRRVAASCGQALVECVMELGGKAPAIVCEDADVELAARAIAFCGFFNAGQACISVERVLAHESIYEELSDRIVDHARKLRQGGPEGTWDVGPMIFPPQLATVEALVDDAVKHGAQVRLGGRRAARAGDFYEPTVLTECTPEMRIAREEIFGPVLPLLRVTDDEDALRVANGIPLGLNGYVFSRSAARARSIAERLEVGSVVVNDVLVDYGAPEVPFGGVKNSGFGRVHGDDALRAMCNVKHIGEPRLPPITALWHPYGARGERLARAAVAALFSRKSPLSRLLG
jgi:succinate-semialdehyde dehydrogenase/glutarate-semialdehyde dehydrogenase